MTERLAQLMQDEAADLRVPHPPIDAILLAGRRERRQRRVLPAIGASAAAAAIVGAVLVLPIAGPESGPSDGSVAVHTVSEASFSAAKAAAAQDAFARGGAFAVGSKVYFGGDDFAVQIDDPAVKAVRYTSAGVLVRHGKGYAMDDASRDNYSLVGTDGSVVDLNVDIGDVSVSTQATQPYLVYAREGLGEGDWEVVVLDLRNGQVAAAVPVEGDFSWGGWDAPPVSLSGGRVYVGLDDAMVAVDWQTGEVTTTPLPPSTYPDVNADRYLQIDDDISGRGELNVSVQVRDAFTGETLLDLPGMGDRLASLSPDGEQVLVLPYMLVNDDGQIQKLSDTVLYTVDTGEQIKLPPSLIGGYGWTPDGLVFSVTAEGTTLCSADTGECVTTPFGTELAEVDLGTVRLGGMVNES